MCMVPRFVPTGICHLSPVTRHVEDSEAPNPPAGGTVRAEFHVPVRSVLLDG
jgi:hypothetical protein